MSLREGWFRPDRHYIEHNSHKARVTRASLSGSIKYQVFIKSVNDWMQPYERAFTELDAALDAAEYQLGLF